MNETKMDQWGWGEAIGTGDMVTVWSVSGGYGYEKTEGFWEAIENKVSFFIMNSLQGSLGVRHPGVGALTIYLTHYGVIDPVWLSWTGHNRYLEDQFKVWYQEKFWEVIIHKKWCCEQIIWKSALVRKMATQF